ncbi:glutathione S-transferase family protein [Mesorhizobium sp. NBSH29]|uniref:glutathione S-transferase family protein n=1 Tax=Mesorhizobium sp. NBSH29 TaxID=2654249 RepID=UPI0018965B88|nr:glutathione S-transferase family protein [Mesorhizobium sp. NBSH29]QPC86214.1 glutathione S-transferase family protein [Mesorhizobium sp. NBSH29]
MTLKLYAHPFSAYCQKVLIALWENDLPFTYRHLGEDDAIAEREQLWPLDRFPVLTDNGKVIPETSIIIEHLDLFHPGPIKLIPEDRARALEVRFMDRFFDNFIMDEMQKPVFAAARDGEEAQQKALEVAAKSLDKSYAWLEQKLAGRTWAAGEAFSMADCAAAPALFYADWVHQIGSQFPTVRAYRSRLLERPSFARAVEEGRKYRHFFPLGAPDRD